MPLFGIVFSLIEYICFSSLAWGRPRPQGGEAAQTTMGHHLRHRAFGRPQGLGAWEKSPEPQWANAADATVGPRAVRAPWRVGRPNRNGHRRRAVQPGGRGSTGVGTHKDTTRMFNILQRNNILNKAPTISC